MSKPFSVYLDLVRFTAACVVVLHHIWPMLVPKHPLPWPGHDAVVVFFVLSGLVIAYAADKRERSASSYIQHRVARIASVAYPSLMLSALIAPNLLSAETFSAAAPIPVSVSDLLIRTGANALFVAQSWSWSIFPPLNAPFWSLNYEVWYYVIFGIWSYSAARWKVLLLLIVAVLAGPKILLLLPVWLLGVIVYRARIQISERAALYVFAGSLVVGLLYFWFDISILIRTEMIALWPTMMKSLDSSNQFVGDTILGLIVATNFAAASSLQIGLRWLACVERPVRNLASFTFSTYLYHLPLFCFLWSVLQWRSPWLVVPYLALGILVLGCLTEKQLPAFRRVIAAIPPWSAVERTQTL